MGQLILLRHGKSIWNERNLFTGWVDVPLSKEGINEALAAGAKIRDIPINVIFTSTLSRALTTALIAMCDHGSGKVPVILHPETDPLGEQGKIHGKHAFEDIIPIVCAQELNERMYGDLQGLNKAETAKKFGAEQVQIWRRSYDTRPPNGESLKMTIARAMPYFEEQIIPHLKAGSNVLVVAHGNSLRGIIKDLEHLDDKQIVELEIPTGIPLLYSYQAGKFSRVW